MAAHGDTKPIWFTEFGWSTSSQVAFQDGGVSMEAQADYLTRAYNCLAQDPYVEVAAWHNLRNTRWHNDADTWAAQLGLMTTDFTPKPAYNALKTYVPGGGGCAYTEVAAPVDPQPAPEPTPQPGPDPRPSDEVEPADEVDPGEEERQQR